MQRRVHGQVMKQPPKNVVFGRRIDGRTSEDKTCLSDVKVQLRGMIAGEDPHDPASGEDSPAPEHEEGHSPELVMTAEKLATKEEWESSGNKLTSSGRCVQEEIARSRQRRPLVRHDWAYSRRGHHQSLLALYDLVSV